MVYLGGKIEDHTGNTIQIWGRMSGCDYRRIEGCMSPANEYNIVVEDPVYEAGAPGVYFQGHAEFLERRTGTNAYGASVPVFVFGKRRDLQEAEAEIKRLETVAAQQGVNPRTGMALADETARQMAETTEWRGTLVRYEAVANTNMRTYKVTAQPSVDGNPAMFYCDADVKAGLSGRVYDAVRSRAEVVIKYRNISGFDAPWIVAVSEASATSQEGSAGSDPLQITDDVKAPRLTYRREPDYPEKAKKARKEGIVGLDAIISASGDVDGVNVVQSVDPLLDEAAVRAVRQWKYAPATKEGKPVRVYLTVTVTFRVN